MGAQCPFSLVPMLGALPVPVVGLVPVTSLFPVVVPNHIPVPVPVPAPRLISIPQLVPMPLSHFHAHFSTTHQQLHPHPFHFLLYPSHPKSFPFPLHVLFPFSTPIPVSPPFPLLHPSLSFSKEQRACDVSTEPGRV